MSTNVQPQSVVKHAASWPPLVYVFLGLILLGVWLSGTAIQVQTSEGWFVGASATTYPTLVTLKQLWDFVTGNLPANLLAPFAFGWGVQLALIVASVGVEMPKHPAWRYYLAWAAVIVLIGVNSCGDWQYSSQYGTWGQLGFTVVILFITFCTGLLAIMCFMHAIHKMQH